jgi:hypothetical protein
MFWPFGEVILAQITLLPHSTSDDQLTSLVQYFKSNSSVVSWSFQTAIFNS